MTDSWFDDQVKTRFCPSPTGLMHLGNARTALFNALLAKHRSGEFLLRIEDTDVERSDERYTQALKRDLHWLGLDWDEGPGKDLNHGPYHQSKRQAIYNDYYRRLESCNLAYPCFCSEEELALSRKIQRSSGKPPRYAGTCRGLSEELIQEKLAAGLKPTLRFRVQSGAVIEFNDMVRGEQRFQTDDIGDFIVRRANGTPPFMFCNAVDDALMGVTHALRGEDHLTNTPRQLMILEALGLEAPIYGHIALIVGSDGSPLSKRHGSRSIDQLRQEGYLPDAVVNYMARLGHYYGHDDLLSLQRLAEQFQIENLSKSPAKFNPAQLDYWQKESIAQLDVTGFWLWVGDDIRALVPQVYQNEFAELVQPNVRFPQEVREWAEVIFSSEWQLDNERRIGLTEVTPGYFHEANQAFIKNNKDLSKVIAHLKENLKIKGKALFQPLRVGLTGHEHGPELAKIVALMEASVIQKRLEALT